jgi:UDP-N-acetylmuramyl pentapeptide synthase
MNLRYLTRIDESTEAAVYELGVTHPGNITRSCKYLKPNIGIITNIDLYHTLGCGTLENYIEAKAELLEGLGNTGILILNTDSPNIRRIDLSKYNGKIYYFGINGDADFKATNLQYSDNLVQFDLIHNNNIYKCSVIGHGDYNVYNALAAIASVTFVGVGIETACRRLATFGQLEKHVEIRTGNNKCRIIDDTWNNSSLSMNTALDILERDNNSKKIAVLGAMFQLGDYSKSEHRNIGFKVAKLNLDYLITLDEESAEIAKAAIEMGMDQSKVHMCLSGIEAWEKLQPHLNQDTTVLTKYSYHYRPYDHMRFFVNNLLK